MGTEQLKIAVGAVADILNGLSKFFNKQGAVYLFGVATPAAILTSLPFAEVQKELQGLSVEGRKMLEDYFASKLDLVNKDAQAKIIAGEYVLEDCFAEFISVYAFVVSEIPKVKALIGVA